MVLKVCSRSQGQPRCGSRRRAMSASSAFIAPSASRVAPASGVLTGRDAQPVKREEHAGGSAPDVAPAEGNVPELSLPAGECGAPAGAGAVARLGEAARPRPPGSPELLPVAAARKA